MPRDSPLRPVDVRKAQAADLSDTEAIDIAEPDHATTPHLKQRRAGDAGEQFLHLFPRWSLRKIFVGVEAPLIDGLSDAHRPPTPTAGIAKERAQRLYMERDAGPLPPARTALVKYAEMVAGDTSDSGIPLPASQARKGVRETPSVHNPGVGEAPLFVGGSSETLAGDGCKETVRLARPMLIWTR
jgi:hypothetical protein